MPGKIVRHKFSMPDTGAKTQCTFGLKLFVFGEHQICPLILQQHFFELIHVIAAIFEVNPAVVGFIVESEITEWNQQSPVDGIRQKNFLHHIAVAQLENILLVGAVRRRGQPKQKSGPEILQHLPVTGRSRMVKFIDHDVIKMIRGQTFR